MIMFSFFSFLYFSLLYYVFLFLLRHSFCVLLLTFMISKFYQTFFFEFFSFVFLFIMIFVVFYSSLMNFLQGERDLEFCHDECFISHIHLVFVFTFFCLFVHLNFIASLEYLLEEIFYFDSIKLKNKLTISIQHKSLLKIFT